MCCHHSFKTAIERCSVYTGGCDLYSCLYATTEFVITERGKQIEFEEIFHASEMRSNKDILGFCAANECFDYFPRGLNEKFPNLTHIELHSCGIKRIAKEDLVGLEKVVFLDLCSNELMKLPDDLFVKMTKLRWIRFARNKIQQMTSKLLQPFYKNKLQCVDFKGNKAIDDYFEVDKHNTLERLMKAIDRQCTEKVEIYEKNVVLFPLSVAGSNELHSDFTIKAGEKKLQVHKCILGTYSPRFREMFTDDQLKELVMDDFDEETVGDFVNLLYGNSTETTDLLNLYRLAVKYECEDLKAVCRETVMENLEEFGVPKTLAEMELVLLPQPDEATEVAKVVIEYEANE